MYGRMGHGYGYSGQHSPWEQWRGDRGSGHGSHQFLTRRRFPNREEIIGRLEEYLKQLQAEAKGVEERIAGLKKEQT